ncbi:Two pore calcium channel protein 1B [Sesamum angolense]|uniref:Two pore calcium channel protein 1B n=1 Tax=Sesamum angolense TaxID=2727404 RepID=A0AAE1W3F1_9LAMI|nr:Two pore calcium channel protein 1B [Sesamum angolense]
MTAQWKTGKYEKEVLAEDGVGIPEEILDQSSFGSSLKSYLRFIQFDFLWSLNYFALILLNFFEKPLWCSEHCSNREYYFLGQLPYLTGPESLIFELAQLVHNRGVLSLKLSSHRKATLKRLKQLSCLLKTLAVML